MKIKEEVYFFITEVDFDKLIADWRDVTILSSSHLCKNSNFISYSQMDHFICIRNQFYKTNLNEQLSIRSHQKLEVKGTAAILKSKYTKQKGAEIL